LTNCEVDDAETGEDENYWWMGLQGLNGNSTTAFSLTIDGFKFAIAMWWNSTNPLLSMNNITRLLAPVWKPNYVLEGRPGIGFEKFHQEDVMLDPLDAFLRGDMTIEWLPPPPDIRLTKIMPNVIFVVPTIESKNSLKLNQTVLPNFVHADEWGYEVHDDISYAFMRWNRFAFGTSKFGELIDGSKMIFTDKAFGAKWELTVDKSQGWIGNNAYWTWGPTTFDYFGHIFMTPNQKPSPDHPFDGNRIAISPTKTIIGALKHFFPDLSFDGDVNLLEQLHWGNKFSIWTADHEDDLAGWPTSYHDPVFSIETDRDTKTEGLHVMHFQITYTDKIGHSAPGNFRLRINDGSEDSPTFTFEKVSIDTHNWLQQWGYSDYFQLNGVQELCLYMDTRELHTVNSNNEWNNDTSENPFNFLIRTGNYEQVPHPENCSTLYTPYNIKSDGIVMAQNIESYAYTLNETATSVAGLSNELNAFMYQMEVTIEDIYGRLASLDSQVWGLNLMVWMELGFTMIAGAAAAGAALIAKEAVAAGGKIVAKVGVDATEGSVEIMSKGVMYRESLDIY
jgi:hypothetical protein